MHAPCVIMTNVITLQAANKPLHMVLFHALTVNWCTVDITTGTSARLGHYAAHGLMHLLYKLQC